VAPTGNSVTAANRAPSGFQIPRGIVDLLGPVGRMFAEASSTANGRAWMRDVGRNVGQGAAQSATNRVASAAPLYHQLDQVPTLSPLAKLLIAIFGQSAGEIGDTLGGIQTQSAGTSSTSGTLRLHPGQFRPGNGALMLAPVV
jgi:hypothetical protein